MKGIILGISLNDYDTEIKIGDLVYYDSGYDEYFTIIDIDDKFLISNKNEKNKAKYITKNKINNKLLNYERHEISKACLGVFDVDKYYHENKKILLGYIEPSDIKNLKYKIILDEDLPKTDINTITDADLIGTIYSGKIIKKPYKSNNIVDYENYFKI